MTDQITELLTRLYIRLGIGEEPVLRRQAEQSVSALLRDREHCIELPQGGCAMGRLLPVAVRSRTESGENQTCRITETAVLWVSGGDSRLLLETTREYTPRDTADSPRYTYPAYREIPIEQIGPDFTLLPPHQPADARQTAVFGLLCDAFGAMGSRQPHRLLAAERGLFALDRAPEKTLEADGFAVTGHTVTIAVERDTQSRLSEDRRITRMHSILLLVNGSEVRLIQKALQNTQFFRSVPVQDPPDGGYYFEDAGESQEVSYRYLTIPEISSDYIPLFL